MSHKLFFVEHLPRLGTILDYGCADGKMAEALAGEEFAGRFSFGSMALFDIDQQMLDRIPEDFWIWKFREEQPALDMLAQSGAAPYPSAILFSSVLHETYTHQPGQMNDLWQRVAATGVEYIIIRDMFWQEGQKGACLGPTRSLTEAGLTQLYKEHLTTQWPSLSAVANHVQFLLKYPYVENWQRELQENYFALPDLRPVLAPLGYEPMHWSHHQVPFIQERIKTDTGIELPFNTHLTAIFKRKNLQS
ncbi:class I SAM-dependent methyltransferase [Hymenobacter metallicola]|uniref:Class I SAM-dependent methyltransferase n=1 Tax=Hymenobacter metallicola TaxID=2563114 RepID=A0A4Z0QKI6_9BACT|nr:hypothetical protein [Hymenobacter metallicola]TGE29763.1 hypothetical protein E5K02_09975 [Hymenobacter metallicola]